MRTRRRNALCLGGLAVLVVLALLVNLPLSLLYGEDVDARVLQAEKDRVAAIEKVKPSVVAIFSPGGQGGGSGVLIDKQGFALTNFHVVQGSGPVMKCGLADGHFYDAVLVGLDKVGDVALVKLLPREGQEFTPAPLGDSDKVKAGDWSLAMGNPFLLATDFTPTVTFGLVSGIHRYQPPEGGGLLEYTDCIQIDTSINPGNSGGPLFNMAGELIGINGRGSFDKRGRVNSGVGYAISINQIKNFMGHLHAGLDADHATLGAVVDLAKDEGIGGKLEVRGILEQSDVARRKLNLGDELVSFAGRPMSSVNQFKNVLGIYPKGWRVPLTYRAKNVKSEVLVRLMGSQAKELDENGKPKPDDQQPQPKPKPAPRKPGEKPSGEAAKLYEAKRGFANFYFNRQERDRLLASFKKHGDFTGLSGEWAMDCELEVKKKKSPAQLTITEEKGNSGARPVVRFTVDSVKLDDLEPLKSGQETESLKQPLGSGGIMMALYHYRELLSRGEKAFPRIFSHGGHEPFYPPKADGSQPKSIGDLRVDTEVLHTEEGDVQGKWYFSLKDQTLLGFEIWIGRNDDPCEVYLSDYREVDGRKMPHRLEVRYGNEKFGTFAVKSWKVGK